MGASWSKSNSAWLQTDKPVYYEGDWVSVLVCLNIVQPVTIAAIDCQLLGVEKTYWTEHHESGSGDTRTTWTTYHGGTAQLLNVDHPLGGAGRELAAGQYQWNVVFGLPMGLPSSFHISSGGDGADVKYSVTLVFHTPGLLSKAIRSTQVLTVRQRLQAPPVIVEQSAEQPLIGCCCINRGMLSTNVKLDKDRCQPGEGVAVILEIDNKSKLRVAAIELSLKREVYARERPKGSGGGTWRSHKEMGTTKHQGVQPFTVLQGGLARRMAVTLPAELPPSMRGSLISCDYYVKVKMNIGSCVKDIKLKVPLVVLAPQPAATEEEPFFDKPPPFWSPTEVRPPEAMAVPSALPPPAELLQPDAPFWARSTSNKDEAQRVGTNGTTSNHKLV